MDPKSILLLLESVRDGDIDPGEALEELRMLPYEDLGFAKVDHHRNLRTGFPEVIYSSGKTPEQVARIAQAILDRGASVFLATRADTDTFDAVRQVAPDAVYHETAHIISVQRDLPTPTEGMVLVAAAGTSDMPVAEEAAVTAKIMGNKVERLYDVGVAGIHRLLDKVDLLRSARVLIVVAGMEGALASIIAGLVDKPVIGVPTSVGYGASFGGLAPLLTMLNSCAAGVSVVNIDNGFG
ncbi:MAG TPA: nickel pincer cofactor biosynthesis protein LarB, partial [Bacillota bacterium]|nr:nickel pincer cofactor biosynthesis protein LarB [Bacillota bacterium]